MPLTNDEFDRLDAARNLMKRQTESGKKKPFQLAIEHLETLQPQIERAAKVIEILLQQRNKSMCWRIGVFFARLKFRVFGQPAARTTRTGIK